MIRSIGKSEDDMNVEIVTLADDGKIPTGEKRNMLLDMAKGKYVVFVDDDDVVSPDYLPQIVKALLLNPDAIGFKGYITTNGTRKMEWRISVKYKYEQRNGIYYRYNNHLSPIRREIAQKIRYKPIYHGEDADYAKRLHEAKLVKHEIFIDKFLYHYDYKTKK
jgi:glycosyltransferase involved in cell wall biosynthesis